MKFKQIKGRKLQEEYTAAGLLFYDCEPYDVEYVRPYWQPKEWWDNDGTMYPKKATVGRKYNLRRYKMFILVEE